MNNFVGFTICAETRSNEILFFNEGYVFSKNATTLYTSKEVEEVRKYLLKNGFDKHPYPYNIEKWGTVEIFINKCF